MKRAALTAILALGLGACANGSVKDTTAADGTRSDGVRSERTLASGTRVGATIQGALSSRTNKAGEAVHAIVSGDVLGALGGVVIPAGSDVTLKVDQLEAGSDGVHPEGRLSLVVSSVSINGERQSVSADLAPVPHHLEGRSTAADAEAVHHASRDVIVSAGTPIVFTLSHALNVSAR
jgi:hypothetical protein